MLFEGWMSPGEHDKQMLSTAAPLYVQMECINSEY